MHEQSITVERDDQHFIESSVEPGKVLEGPFATPGEALERSRSRSKEADLIPSFDKDIIPDFAVNTEYGADTSDWLSHLAAGAEATFTDKAPEPAASFRHMVSSKGREQQFRASMSAKEQLEQNRFFNEFMVDKIYQGAPAAELESYVKGKASISDPDKSVMERRSAQWLVDQGLKTPERATVIVNEGMGEFEDLRLLQLSKTDVRQETLTTFMALETTKARIAEKLKGQSYAADVLDWATLLLVPGVSTVAAGVKDRKFETLGDKIGRDVRDLWALPIGKRLKAINDFEKALEDNVIVGSNLVLAMEQIQQLIDRKPHEGAMDTFTEMIDAIPILGGLWKGIKAVKTISGAARMAGAPDVSVGRALTLKEQEAGGKVLSPREEGELNYIVLPSSATDASSFVTVVKNVPGYKALDEGTSVLIGEKPVGRVHQALEEAALVKEWEKVASVLIADAQKLGYNPKMGNIDPKEILEVLKDTVIPPLLRVDEQMDATVYAIRALLNRFGHDVEASALLSHPKRYPLYDVEIDNLTAIPTVHVYLGHGLNKLKGFVSEAAAHAGAERLGIEKGFYSISERSGEYLIRVSKEATGTSFIKPSSEKSRPWVMGVIGKWLQGSATIMDEASLEGARLAVLSSSKLNKAVSASVDAINGLKSNSRKIYDNLMLEVQQGNKWKSISEVHDWYATNYQRKAFDKEIEAYIATRHLYKFDWMVRNAAVHRALSGMNYEEILFKPQYSKEAMGLANTKIENIKVGKVVVTTSLDTKLVNIMDVEEGKMVNFRDRDALSARLKENENLVLVKLLQHDKQLGDYVIVNKSDINVRPLRERVLNEIDGPHRIYNTGPTGGYIKQQVTRWVNGTEVLMSPRTHFAVQSGIDGKRFAEEYNIALSAFNTVKKATSPIERAMVDDIISTNTRFSGYDEMAKAMKDGKIERTPFEFVRPGELPNKNIEGFRGTEAIDPDFKNLSHNVMEDIDNKRLFYSERGERLLHPDGEKAALLHPGEILKRAINNVINTQSFDNYKHREIAKWVATFGKYLDGAPNRPDLEKFMYGQFNLSPNAQMNIRSPALAQAEAQRLAIKRMLNQPGQLQVEAAKLRDSIIDVIEGTTGYSAAKAAADILSSNPLMFARGVAYHSFLGLGDVSQMIVQMSMLPGIIAVSPKHGMNALMSYPFIRMALMNPKHDEWVGALYNKFSLGKGTGADTFSLLMRDLRKSGIDIVDGNVAELGTFTKTGNIPGFIASMTGKAVDAASFAFKEGEKANRLVGWSIAWAERHAITGKGITTAEEFGQAARRANTFASNMSKDGKAFWQEGWMSLPAQFLGHPARVAELLLHPSSGFTGVEKARYYAGLALAYGPALGAGGWVGEYFKQKYFEANGTEPNKTMVRTFGSGLAGLIFPDTDVSRLQPAGQAFPFSDFFSSTGVKAYDLLGPPGELGNRFFDAFIGSRKLHALVSGEISSGSKVNTVVEIAHDVLKSVSSYGRIDKAITAAQTGKLYSNSGILKQSNLNNLDAAMLALGFPPRESKEAYQAELALDDIQKKIFKDAKIASQFLIKSWEFPAGSEQYKRNMDYFEYIRNLNVDGDVSGNGGQEFTKAVFQLVKTHKAFTDNVALDYQRTLGRYREDLKR